VAAFCS